MSSSCLKMGCFFASGVVSNDNKQGNIREVDARPTLVAEHFDNHCLAKLQCKALLNLYSTKIATNKQRQTKMSSKFPVYRMFSAPFFIVAASAIISNAFLIHALRKKKLLQTISYKFILYLSISDICIGILVVVTQFIVLLVTNMKLLVTLETCTAALLYTFSQFSAFMILAIGIDRYIHMKYLANYAAIMTNFRARLIVSVNIAVSICVTLFLVCGHMFGFIFPAQLSLNVIIIGFLISVTALYLRAYMSVKARVDQLELESGPGSSSRRDSNKEFSKAVLFILSSLVICYTPYIIGSIVRHRNHHANDRVALFVGFSSLLVVYSNSTLNAVIFLLLNKPLKNYLLQTYKFLRGNRVLKIDN